MAWGGGEWGEGGGHGRGGSPGGYFCLEKGRISQLLGGVNRLESEHMCFSPWAKSWS